MSDFAVNLPINSVSFGQVGIALLKEIKSRGLHPSIFPVSDVDLSAEKSNPEFEEWIQDCIHKSLASHSRDIPLLKLWHLNPDSLQSLSNKTVLLTFYELDSPTLVELNISKNNDTVVTSRYTQEVFKKAGQPVSYVPLGFDKHNFKVTGKEYFTDGRVVFNLCGKFEHRKRHEKVLKAWVKEFGNDTKYHLQCALYNKFMQPEENNAALSQVLGGKKYNNINFLNFMPKNSLYNDFLNSGDIIIGMSGGEGWSLPEFHSVALGKHAIILDAHVHKDWATEKNAVLVAPLSEKIDAADGKFFVNGAFVNQGKIFDFSEEDFIKGCHTAIDRLKKNQVNEEGKKLQLSFNYAKTLDGLLERL